MKRKKRLLSSVRLLIMSLLLLCLLPLNVATGSSSTLIETSDEHKQLNVGVKRSIQEDALDITEIVPGFTATVISWSHSDTCQTYQIRFRNNSDDSANISLGWYGSEDEGLYLPFSVAYTIVDEDGNTDEREAEFEKSSSGSGAYQGIGPLFDSYLTMNIDIFINPGETIVEDSLRFYNVFEIERVRENNVTTFVKGDQPYYIDSSQDYFTYSSTNIDLTQYISASMDYISTLGKYISFTFTVHNDTIPLYEEQMSGRTDYQTNQDRIASGDFRYEFSFSNMTSAFLLLSYEDDSMVSIDVVDDYAQNYAFTIDDGDTQVHLLTTDVDLDGLVGVSLCSSMFNISIVNVDTLADITSSSYSTRFGAIYFDVQDDDISNVSVINVLNILIITLVVVSVVYIAGIIIAYFICRERYKNDEFRRVQPKKFFKINILGYLAVIVLLMDIMIICYRVNYIASAIATFNPLDNYIVCLSVIGIIFIGYFIRYFYLTIKNYLERKKKQKLHIEFDAEDDGLN